MEGLAVAVGVGLSFGIVLLAGRWIYGRLSESIAARLHSSWRWLALPITGVLCGGAFAVLRPLIVDQPRTPLWFVLAATAVALLVATGTALGWTLVRMGRGFVALVERPVDPHDQQP